MKKTYLIPIIESYSITTEQMIAASDEIRGGGPGIPSAKSAVMDLPDDDDNSDVEWYKKD